MHLPLLTVTPYRFFSLFFSFSRVFLAVFIWIPLLCSCLPTSSLKHIHIRFTRPQHLPFNLNLFSVNISLLTRFLSISHFLSLSLCAGLAWLLNSLMQAEALLALAGIAGDVFIDTGTGFKVSRCACMSVMCEKGQKREEK